MASIIGVYLALFGRPGDPAGLEYFTSVTNDGQNLAAIGNLAATAEYQNRFAGKSSAEIITSIYQSLFNRGPDAVGLNFFKDELASGRQTVNTIAINIMDGALANPTNSDFLILANKLLASALFTAALENQGKASAYAGDAAAAIGRNYLAAVGTDGSQNTNFNAALAAVNSIPAVAALNNVPALTPNDGDNVLGTNANDIFNAVTDENGTGASLQAGDIMDGGLGIDTINIFSTSPNAPLVGTFNQIEKIFLRADSGEDGFAGINLAKFPAASELWQVGGNVAREVVWASNQTKIGYENTSGSEITAATGATKIEVALKDAINPVFRVGAIDPASVKTIEISGTLSEGSNIAIDLDNRTTSGLALNGEEKLVLNLFGGSANGQVNVSITSSTLTALDASGSIQSMNFGVLPSSITSIVTGSGNDTLVTGATPSTVTSGDGNDNITTGSGGDSIFAGSGANRIKTGDGFDKIYVGYNNAQDVITDFQLFADSIIFLDGANGTFSTTTVDGMSSTLLTLNNGSTVTFLGVTTFDNSVFVL